MMNEKERAETTARNFDKFLNYSKILDGIVLYQDDKGHVGLIRAGFVKNPLLEEIFKAIVETIRTEATKHNIPSLVGNGTITNGVLKIEIINPQDN